MRSRTATSTPHGGGAGDSDTRVGAALRRMLPSGGLADVLGDPAAADWQRPLPSRAALRRDLVGAMLLSLIGMCSLALTESYAGLAEGTQRWWGYAIVAVITVPLAMRRRHPVAVLIFTTVVFISSAYVNMMAVGQLSTQVAYFASVYATVAWGRSRQVVGVVIVLLAITIGLWLMVDLSISSSYQQYVQDMDSQAGPLDPITAYALYSIFLHVAFFGGAIYAGQASWRAALTQHRNREQAQTIERQSTELARRAVVDERLRIARELHDVVAHHVSAIGIQAGAARMVLTTNPTAAQEALRTVETSSRQAVTETRQLLGVLRDETRDVAQFVAHGAADLDALFEEYAQRGLSVALEEDLDEASSLRRLPPALGASLYRCAQESLTNVLQHSSARRVEVVLRSRREDSSSVLELTVLDRGHPIPNSSGGGFGLVGLRERAHLHGGRFQAGPRDPGPGWQVRFTFPLQLRHDDADTDPARGSQAAQPPTREV